MPSPSALQSPSMPLKVQPSVREPLLRCVIDTARIGWTDSRHNYHFFQNNVRFSTIDVIASAIATYAIVTSFIRPASYILPKNFGPSYAYSRKFLWPAV